MNDRNPVAVWFEIPATDFDRAARFYEKILGVTLRREAIGPMTLGVFPIRSRTPRAASWRARASPQRGRDDHLSQCGRRARRGVATAWEAGGAVLTPVTDLPEGLGRFAHLRDTEGNRVGLHAA